MRRHRPFFTMLLAASLLGAFAANTRLQAQSQDPVKARVTFNVSTAHPGQPLALLLDKQATAFENIMVGPDFEENPITQWFELAIPACAVNEDTIRENCVLYGGGASQSLEVVPGIYDLFVVEPYLGSIYNTISIIRRFNDVYLAPGVEYVIYVDSAVRNFSYYKILAPWDMQVERVVSHGVSEANLTSQEAVSVMFKNTGLNPVTSFNVSYSFDGGNIITETANVSIPVGTTAVYTLRTKADWSAKGTHTVKVIAELEGDVLHNAITDLGRVVHGSDTLLYTVEHAEPVTTLPFKYDFSNKDAFFSDWAVYDLSGDVTWGVIDIFDRIVTDEHNNCARITTMYVNKGEPEAMVMRRPLHLTPGKYHFLFKALTTAENRETFSMLCGAHSYPANMNTLRTFAETKTDYKYLPFTVNFDIETEGNYFFAVAADSALDPFFICVDDIEIDTGYFVTRPELKVDGFAAPASSCGLTAKEALTLKVSNVGTADITGIKATGKVDGKDFEKVLDIEIPSMSVNQAVTVDSFDFSAGGQHQISVALQIISHRGDSAEIDASDNAAQLTFYNWLSSATLPFGNDFTSESNEAYTNWDMQNAWQFNAGEEALQNLEAKPLPMYSRCLELKADSSYRFSVQWKYGKPGETVSVLPEDMEVYCGLTGTDISTWQKIGDVYDGYSQGEYVTATVTFSPEHSGTHTLAVYCPTAYGSLFIKQLSVYKVTGFDLRMRVVGPMPMQLPVEHLNATFPIGVAVQNTGSRVVDSARVVIDYNGSPVGSQNFAVGEPGSDLAAADVTVTVSGGKVGDKAVFTATAAVVGHEDEDDSPFNNRLSTQTDITDTVLAYDRVTEDMCTIGSHCFGMEGTTIEMGIVFNLHVRDTLTGVRVFWGEARYPEERTYDCPVTIYKIAAADDTTVSSRIQVVYKQLDRKRDVAGPQDYTLPALILSPGYYFVTIHNKGLSLVGDLDDNGATYYVMNGTMYSTTYYGNPGIRALFGHSGKPMAKDAEVVSLDRPSSEGYFAVNQPVEVTLGNRGHQALKGVKATLTVDGEKAGETTTDIKAYGWAPVKFTANLSNPGQHTLTVTVEAEGDEDAANNTMTQTITTLRGNIDPYVLDFEYCEDFTTDVFMPDWKSVNADGMETYAFDAADNISFPHAYEAYGFIAFNPGLLGVDIYEGLEPYQESERYGAAFAAFDPRYYDDNFPAEDLITNDDWLISPALKMPDKEPGIKFFVSAYKPYYHERFEVLVSETGRWGEFTKVFDSVTPHPDNTLTTPWEYMNVSLAGYEGKTVYIAIRCVSKDGWMFKIDNIRVTKPGAANQDAAGDIALNLYPNPARRNITLVAEDDIEYITLYNIAGKQIYAGRHTGRMFRYNVSALTPGLYFAKVKTAQGSGVVKFVVE